jgi:hypothetical protein
VLCRDAFLDGRIIKDRKELITTEARRVVTSGVKKGVGFHWEGAPGGLTMF